jgi:hypothetical protein
MENEAIFKVDEKMIYKAGRINGKLWIKPDEVIAKTVQKGGLQEILDPEKVTTVKGWEMLKYSPSSVVYYFS